jgi:hypothetical protein
MCKAVDQGLVIGPIQLEEKTGGRRGHFRRPAPRSDPEPDAGAGETRVDA